VSVFDEVNLSWTYLLNFSVVTPSGKLPKTWPSWVENASPI
jgi:hypothetical protein